MAFANKVILLGNLTRDPQSKQLNNGTTVAEVGIAVNRKWAQKDEVLFLELVAFGKLAETVCQYGRKGMQVYVDGRLKMDSWDDRESGQKRTKIYAVIDTFQMLGSPQPKPGDHGFYQPQRQPQQPAPFLPPEDDLPF